MNREEEIRARALEIAVGLLGSLPPESAQAHIVNSGKRGETPEQAVIALSKAFEAHIKG
jgi:hypothetical protein